MPLTFVECLACFLPDKQITNIILWPRPCFLKLWYAYHLRYANYFEWYASLNKKLKYKKRIQIINKNET